MGHRLLLAAALALVLAGCATANPGACEAEVAACTSDADCDGFQCTAGCCTRDRLCQSNAECPDPGTVCNGGLCGPPAAPECTTSRDCAGHPAGNICGPAGACVRCLTNNDCATNGTQICTPANTCAPRPGGCSVDANCTESGRGKCKQDERLCVECLNTADCIAGSGNVCASNRCVPPPTRCTANTDCLGSTPYCDAARGACVECLDRSQCDFGQRCEASRCVAAPTCADDDGCEAGRCLVATGACVECLSAADCPDATFACDPASHACRPSSACAGNADCAGRAGATKCLLPAGFCVACLGDLDCGAGERCTNNACTAAPAGCATNAECLSSPSGLYCQAATGACVACLEGAHCPSGRCDAAAGTCLPGCAGDGNCPAAAPRCEPATAACVECLGDDDCPAGRVCTNDACVPGCRSAADCAAPTPLCDLALAACVECATSAECSGGASCQAGRCVAPATGGVGQPCAAGDTCTDDDAVCWPDSAGPRCRRTCDPYGSGCEAGQACSWFYFLPTGAPVGACLPRNERGGPGATCQDAADCELDLLCLSTSATGGRCGRLCDPAATPPGCESGDTCRALPALYDPSFAPPAGPLLTVGACVSASSDWGKPCSSDYSTNGADCAGGLTCGPNMGLLDDSFRVSTCQFPFGTAEANTSCTSGAGCRTGDCLEGPAVCNTSCKWTSDCTRAGLSSNARCVAYVWQGESAWTGELVSSATGACLPTCLSDASCAAAGSYCKLTTTFENSGLYQSSFQTYCAAKEGTERGPNRAAGARCREDGECASGFCVTNGRPGATDGWCSGVCNPAAAGQCDPANGVVCDALGVGLRLNDGPDRLPGTGDDAFGKASLCSGRRCGADADCAGASADPTQPRVCSPILQVDGPNSRYNGAVTSLRNTCQPRVGAGGAGANCTANADCGSGRCLEFTSGARRCYGACRSNADCATGSRCDLALDFGFASLPACVPQ
jgi:hypothetical protein